MGGYSYVDGPEGNPTNLLQIYDIPTRTWRLGARSPTSDADFYNLIVDGKWFLWCYDSFEVYDPQSDTWTQEIIPIIPTPTLNAAPPSPFVCTHNGRIVFFYSDGAAFERAAAGTWSPCEAAMPEVPRDYDRGNGDLTAFGSVLLG